MKIKKIAIRKFKNIQAFTPVLVVGLLIVAGAVIYNFNARAATAGFFFESAATAHMVGETFTVNVYEDSTTDCANVAVVDLSYPANLLQYQGFSSSNSKFESTAQSTESSGRVSLVQFTTRKECGTGSTATSGVSGKQLIGTLSFKAIAVGSAPLNFVNSTLAISSADNKTNVAAGNTPLSFTLTTAPIFEPPVTTPPPPPNNPPAQNGKPDTKRNNVTRVTLPGSDDSIALTDNDVLEVETPVDVQPLPVQPDGINRIEYYLNGDLIETVKTPPYKFRLDTTKYLNGDYTLTTKTYYSNGQTKSVSQKVVVKNPFGISQIKLWAQKFAWLIILLLLVIGAGVAAWIIHRKGGSGPDNNYGDGSADNAGDYTVSGGTFIKPSDPPQN